MVSTLHMGVSSMFADLTLTSANRTTCIISGVTSSLVERHSADYSFSIPFLTVQPVEARLRLLGDLGGADLGDMNTWTLYDFYYVLNEQ